MKEVFTGRNDLLLDYLRDSLSKCHSAVFLVSFVMDSGIKLLLPSIESAIERGAKIEIFTSDYMGVTQPNALYRLFPLTQKGLSILIYHQEPMFSFHPKAYFFDFEQGESSLIIGSSNLSESALRSGVEWNIAINNNQHSKQYHAFMNEYQGLKSDNSKVMDITWLRQYQERYVNKGIYEDIKRSGHKRTMNEVAEDNSSYNTRLEPQGFQIPALYELNLTREEGHIKALMIAATGLGKTYLSAFDSKSYKKILFIAHREEILQQAMKSFKKVQRSRSMGIINGQEKCDIHRTDVIFASIQTIGKLNFIEENRLTPGYFDYIIVDEFHHAVAPSYQLLINYFTPQFLLGMTATPDRMDNKDIYRLCHYNIAGEYSLKTGINQKWLCPFHYYGIYDDTSFEGISIRNGKYDVNELEASLSVNQRAELIYQKYLEFNLEKSVAFCAGIRHAEYMNAYFKNKGIFSECVHSGSSERQKTIKQFESGSLQILFVVDIFNEGIDIPKIDSVLFLRPTESVTIFIQQMGRGLRKSEDKEFLTILDFVGNYNNAHLKPMFLSGSFQKKNNNLLSKEIGAINYPDECLVNFDFRIIDIFKKMSSQKIPINTLLSEEYQNIRQETGHSLSPLELFESTNYSINFYLRQFTNWFALKKEMNDASEYELSISKLSQDFFNMLFKTSMTKSYKMTVFLSMIEDNQHLKLNIHIDNIIQFYQNFYLNDLTHQKDIDLGKISDKKKCLQLIEKNPINFLSDGQMKQFFMYDAQEKIFSFSNELRAEIEGNYNNFVQLFSSIVIYRLNDYYRRKYNEEDYQYQ